MGRDGTDLLDVERYLQILLDSVPDLIFFKDRDCRFTQVNAAFAAFVGLQDPRAAIGRSDADFFPAEDAQIYRADEHEILTTGKALIGKPESGVDADGQPRWVLTNKVPIRNHNGEITGLVGIAREITQLKQAEDALRRSEAGLAEAQRLAHIGSWEWDIASDHVTWSDELYRIFGTTRERFAASYAGYLTYIHPEDRPRIEGIIAQALASHEGYAMEHRVVGSADLERTIWATGEVLLDPEGRVTGLRGTAQDISQRKRIEEDLRHLAYHDSLTHLPNRSSFIQGLKEALAQPRGTEGLAVLFLDLDRFKVINDSLGHLAGDQVLIATGMRLRTLLRKGEVLARLGGDEFAVMLARHGTADDVAMVARDMLAAFEAPFTVEGREFYMTASIGIALETACRANASLLVRAADVAMYQAKARGPGNYAVFDPEMHARALEHLELETDLKRAIERKQLIVHYQPQIRLDSGSIVAVEALLRWQHPTRGLLQPGDFLPRAEETGLMLPIGRWVLEEACRQAIAWRREKRAMDIQMCINLSAWEFRQLDLVSQVAQLLEETGLPPAVLVLEITEQVIVDNDAAFRTLEQLHDLGVHLALDDFGTGHSALASLRRLPVETLKIDRSFVQELVADVKTRTVVRGVTALAHDLGMQVVAEGVETEVQLEAVRELGVDVAQGFCFAPALPAEACMTLLTSGFQRWPGPR